MHRKRIAAHCIALLLHFENNSIELQADLALLKSLMFLSPFKDV